MLAPSIAGKQVDAVFLATKGSVARAVVARLQEAGLTARVRTARQAAQDHVTADEIGGAR